MWRIETIDRTSHIIVQIFYDDDLVGSMQFWNDEQSKKRVELWKKTVEWMNKQNWPK